MCIFVDVTELNATEFRKVTHLHGDDTSNSKVMGAIPMPHKY